MVAVMELYREELIKISDEIKAVYAGVSLKHQMDTDIEVIKKVAKDKIKSIEIVTIDTRLLILQMKTVEIRLCRGTLLWESFNTRINLMYNIVNVFRNYQGLINLEKLIVYKNNDKTIQMMKNYIENNDIENRKVDIKEVKKTIINA